MRVLIQRVSKASVAVNGETVSYIARGMLIFLAIHSTDTEKEAAWLVDKCIHLRIFEDEHGKMNLSIMDINGAVLIVSQFTLYGDVSKGRRPNFSDSASPEAAKRLYEYFIALVRTSNVTVGTGIFRAAMTVDLSNDGPVTLMLEKNART